MKPAIIPVFTRDDNKKPEMSYLSYLTKYNHERKQTKPVVLDSKIFLLIEASYSNF